MIAPVTTETRYDFSTRAQVRDLGDAGLRLQGWLRTHLPGAADLTVTDVRMPSSAGVANETLMLETRRTLDGAPVTVRYVVRVDTHDHLFLGMDLAAHHRIYATMAEVPGVPVPAVLGLEADASVLGDRFFVMEHVYGRVPPDRPNFNEAGWVKDLAAPQRARLSRAFVETMAAMHAADVTKFEFLKRPHLGSSGLEQEMRHWLGYADWCKASEIPVIAASARWLVEHFPKDPPTEFAWGDARMQNVMFHEDGSCAAIFDWDMVSLGGPEADLAWHAITEQSHTAAVGKPRLEGIFTPQAVVDCWEATTGRKVRNWDWQLIFASFRSAAISFKMGSMLKARGELAPQSEYLLNNNGGMQWLAQLLDLPPPGPITRPFRGLDK